MTVDLMQKRFKVIAPFPFIERDGFEVGMILTLPLDETKAVLNQRGEPMRFLYYNNYPAIFKELQWWEELSLEDMPEYVKCKDSCCCVTTNFLKDKVYKLSDLHSTACYKWFLPATEQEYLTYQNKLNGKDS